MTTKKLILVCKRCSLRVHHLDPADIPERGIVCGRCRNRMMPNEAKPDNRRRRRQVVQGPGTELKKLLAELGLTGVQGCGCNAKAAQMNRWGVAGCRERFEEIRQWLAEARGKATWLETLSAAAAAVTTGLAAQIDPRDIEGSLLRLAIERAERALSA